MANRERRIDRAAWLIRRDAVEVGNDLRTARLAAGLTLEQVGRAIGISAPGVMRIERARPPGPRPETLARHAAAVGMRARLRVYPDGEPIRDAAQVELMRRFRERLGTPHRFAVEVPVSDATGDLRAWDAVLTLPGCVCALEFVTRFHDCQAQLRAFQLKLRDGSVDRLIVVVSASRANRRALASAHDIVATTFPIRTRQIMSNLAAGQDPRQNGLVLL